MTQELIVVTLVLAAVAILIAARLGLGAIRRRRHGALIVAPPTWRARQAPDGVATAHSPRDQSFRHVDTVATAFRQHNESELAWRIRSAQARAGGAPPTVAAPGPPPYVPAPPLAPASRAGATRRPMSPAYGARAAASTVTAAGRSLGLSRAHAAIVAIASAAALVALVAIPPWFQGQVLTSTARPSGPLAAVAPTPTAPAATFVTGSPDTPPPGATPWPGTDAPPSVPAVTPPGDTTGEPGGGTTTGGPAVEPTPTDAATPPQAPRPVTDPPITQPPITEPPITEPPITEPPPPPPPPPPPAPTPTPAPTPRPTPRPTPTPSPAPTPTPTAAAAATPTPTPNPPVVAFDWMGGGPAVKFHDRSRGDLARTWDFGDGGTATEKNPWHTYAAPGTYDVTLEVVDGAGNHASLTQQVTVDF